MKIFVTYGYGYNQRNNYSVVEKNSREECFNEIYEVCGQAYACTYPEEGFDRQIKEYNLTEIPLQPQTQRANPFEPDPPTSPGVTAGK